MKCFAVKSGNTYIKDVPVALIHSWYDGSSMETTQYEDEIKHYRNKSNPKSWIKRNTASMKLRVESAKKKYDKELAVKKQTGKSSYYLNRYREHYQSAKTIYEFLKSAEVVEQDVETPNFPSDKKVMWFNGYYNKRDSHPSNMVMRTVGHSRFVCKACNLKMKNVPFYELPEGNNARICIPCLYLRLDKIKSAYESMDKTQRDTITNEHIISGI